jgi:hypothetical protein
VKDVEAAIDSTDKEDTLKPQVEFKINCWQTSSWIGDWNGFPVKFITEGQQVQAPVQRKNGGVDAISGFGPAMQVRPTVATIYTTYHPFYLLPTSSDTWKATVDR